MKKNLLNSVLFKVPLLFTGLFFSAISFAQTVIGNGQTVLASTITPNTAVTINAGGTLDMDQSRDFNSVTTAGAGVAAITGVSELRIVTPAGLMVAGGNELSTTAPITTTNLTTANLNNQSAIVSGAGSIDADALTINGVNGATATFSIGAGLTVQTGSLAGGAGNGQTIYNLIVNGTLRVSGAIATNGNNAIANFTANAGSTVEYNGTVGQDIFPGSYSNLTLSGNNIKKFPNAGGPAIIDINGNFTIGTGTTFQGSNNKPVNLAGDLINNGTFIQGQGSSPVTFDGSVAQTIGGSQPTTFRAVVFANTNGGITLAQPVTITAAATFTDGIVTTDAVNLLIFNDAATSSLTIADEATTSYVSGPVRKIGTAAFVFPIGKANGFVPLQIGASSGGANTFTAEYIRATPPNRDNITAPGIERLSSCEYWTLDRTAGGSAVDLTLHWNANSPCGGTYITAPAAMRAVHYNGTEWNTASVGFGTGSPAAGSVTWGTLNSFSPAQFALGTVDAIANPLPVVFANVKAYGKGNGVQIEWSNLTEKDVASYSVERSANGKDFSGIAEQSPTSNQNDKADYSAFDASPVAGVNYYRIKAVETTGKIVYSKVLSVNLGKAGKGLSLYPNPVIGNHVTISLSNIKNGQYNVRVLNVGGQDIHKQVITNLSSNFTQTIDLPSSIKPGVYNMVVTGDDYRESKMFIVQ